MGFTEYYVNIFVSLVLFAFLGLILSLFHELVVKPMKLQAISLKQGIKGPPLSLLIKNIREIKKAQSSIVKVPSTHPLPLTTAVLYSFHSLSNGGNNMVCIIMYCIPLNPMRVGVCQVFVFSLGTTQTLLVNQLDAVKEITTCTSLALGKPSYQQKDRGPLFG
ncbi:hypothetical protein PVK06_024798 [Gossypium arboreum]|uniref:Uncharacterized protein n=1 Tax=Gossypium arboreum TaxID=29729 RepID=A0ABR0PF42_GOSAR|nr:hypothetical protein PVK06_024798 [Gossypium arboreum]